MATISFTSALRRFIEAPTIQVEGATVRETLAAVFASRPMLRGYILDDQGALRRHVSIYINGSMVQDRSQLSDPVGPDDQVYVVQALSGG